MEYENTLLQGVPRFNGPEPAGLPELLLQANLPLIFTAGLALFFFFTLVSRVSRHLIGKFQPKSLAGEDPKNHQIVHRMHSEPGPASPDIEALQKLRFQTRNLSDVGTDRLYRAIELCAKSSNVGYRVIAYPRLGEVLEPKFGAGSGPEIHAAASTISSKRLDYAVLDRLGRLICAIDLENQSRPRDTMKAEALRLARVPLVEIGKSWTRAEVSAALAGILEPGHGASQHGHTAVHM